MLQFPMLLLSDQGRWSWLDSSPVSHTPTPGPALDHTADHLEWYLLKFPKETNALNWPIVDSPSALLWWSWHCHCSQTWHWIWQSIITLLMIMTCIRTVQLIIDNDNYWGLHVAARHDDFEPDMAWCSVEAPTRM